MAETLIKNHLIETTGCDTALIHAVVDVFLETIPEALDHLQWALKQQVAPKVYQAAHYIKGAALNVGGERLTELAKALELRAKTGSLDHGMEHYRQIYDEYQALKKALESCIWDT